MAEKKEAMWLGGVNGHFMTVEEQEQMPAIAKLGQDFKDFQNGQYRGEFNQKWSLTFGEIRDLLLEVSRLIKKPEPRHSDLHNFDNRAEI